MSIKHNISERENSLSFQARRNHQTAETAHYFYHPDHLGSASWVTDSSGKAIQHLQYLPFGETRVDQRATGSNWSTRYSFSAKEKDEESGYGYFGARYYDSDLSIWLSVDPLASEYPSLSPYNYCANNPIRLIDPNGEEVFITGEASEAAFKKLQGATNIKLEMGSNGKISIAREGNDPSTWNENDGKLFAAVMSNEVTVNLTANNSNLIEEKADGTKVVSENGGAFMGNTLDYNDKGKATSASTQQFVSMDKLKDKYHPENIGGVISHEITESYMGGLISIDKGKAASPALSNSRNKIYNQSHRLATPCPRMKSNYILSPAMEKTFRKNGESLRSMGF